MHPHDRLQHHVRHDLVGKKTGQIDAQQKRPAGNPAQSARRPFPYCEGRYFGKQEGI
jgi:hypothetical protein